MKFSQVKNLTVPEGSARVIRHDGIQLWKRNKYVYVSFGDSIAAGHAIDKNWELNYGTRSQYGENGNTQTVIVADCYTDLIREQILAKYPSEDTNTISFAHSGDQVHHLIAKLDDENVKNWLRKADLVTICIGANNILTPAMSIYLEKYINAGDSALVEFDAAIDSNLAILSAGRDSKTNVYPAGSYGSLFDKLYSINERATYILTTIYNPYKYLWLDEGRDGFFQPFVDSIIPEWTIHIPVIDIEFPMSDTIKNGLLGTSSFRKLFDRVNGLGAWLDPRIERLNQVIRNCVAEYNTYRGGKSNFKVAETKQAFDTYPDRPVSATVHYNDLVNVSFTRGYKSNDLDWALLWRTAGKSREDYFYDMVAKHTYWMTTDPFVDFDLDGYAAEIGEQIVTLLIVPNADPHPKSQGHIVLKDKFDDNFVLL